MARQPEGSDTRPQPFSPIDRQFLNALMTSIGYAVDNARLLEEAQGSTRRLQTVVDDLRATQEQLVRGETLRAIGQLAAGMAHHLNNLFAVILGRSELLLGKAEDASTRRSLEIIRRAAEDGADVARRVQRFSRLHPTSEQAAVDDPLLLPGQRPYI
jgi:signal transduction histidine kinase